MAENVVSLTGAEACSDRRAEFLRVAAKALDEYSALHGHEPEGMFVALNAMNGDSGRSWMVTGAAEGYATLLMVMAHVDWAAEIGRDG